VLFLRPQASLETTVSVVVGDGRTSLLWSNKWINKYIIHLIAVLASQQDVSMSEHINCMSKLKAGKLLVRPVRLAYQPPASSNFLSEQTSHQQSASSTFLSEQTSTSHQPPAKRTG
jgi:hypothetical protein